VYFCSIIKKRKKMAIPIRSVPVLEGEVARRFIKEAKENEKKRGSLKFSEEDTASFYAMIEKAKKNGSFLFL
jgi:hypothetical protein